MRTRFVKEKKNKDRKNLFLSMGLFAAVIFAFWVGIGSVSAKTEEEELLTLEKAVMRDLAYCYAMEGFYPSSLNYLTDNYGLTYNEDKYWIDYHPMGANIMPDVSIIRKTEK